MNRIISLIICTSFCISGISQSGKVIDKVVATVGSENILLSDVEERFAYERDRNPSFPDEGRCYILEQLMTSKLLINQAALDSIIITPDEVESQMQSRLDYMLSFVNNDVTQLETYYGKTIGQIRSEERENMRNQLTEQRMRSEILKNVHITPTEVKAFFNSIPRDSLPFFNSEVEVSEIVVVPDVNEEQRQIAIDKLIGLRDRVVKDGESFSELAGIYSDDPGSAKQGGDLGMQKRGTFVPEFEAAAYNLEEGEISDIVESAFGYHIIQLIERRGNLIHVRHILVKPEVTENDLLAAEKLLDSVRMLVEADSLEFEVAVKVYGNEDEQSFNNSGRMVNPKSGDTFFETADLDWDIYSTTDTMEIGQVSPPLRFRKPDGSFAYRIIQLNSQTEPHRASLEQDYTKIKKAAIEQRKNKYLQEWIFEKVQGTFVEIEPLFKRHCPNLEKWNAADPALLKPSNSRD